jgi:hypothetical protein
MGWPATVRVWLPAWMRDRAGVLARIREAMDRPVAERPRFVSVAAASPEAVGEEAVAREAVVEDEETAPAGQLGAAPSGIVLAPFEVAADSVIANQSVLENMRMARPAIERIGAEVLATEGPIPLARLVATVARRFGYSRMGEGRRNELSDALGAEFRVVDGFAWPPTLDPATWRGARRSPSSAARALTEVGPHEIANVVEMLVRESFSITRDDLLKEACDVLGYSRLTEQGRAWLTRGVDLALLEARIVVEDRHGEGERIRLPE